jgi:menaquinone-dependent protoporphyrinogen oxidase
MRPILIVHASKYGQTAKIADRLANVMRVEGMDTVVMRADEVPVTIDLTGFAGVVVGAPVLVGKHPKPARRFVTAHRATLDHLPTAFFSVSNSAAGKELSHQVAAQRMIAEFLERTKWRPTRTASFAGAVAYTKYGPITKWVMRKITEKSGGPTDTTRDHELTDWSVVDRFAREFSALAASVSGATVRAKPAPAAPDQPGPLAKRP